jgi:hypothetical protein
MVLTPVKISIVIFLLTHCSLGGYRCIISEELIESFSSVWSTLVGGRGVEGAVKEFSRRTCFLHRGIQFQ